MRLQKEKVTSQEEKGEDESTERHRENDVTVQSAPSAQPLRCGLAPSSQTRLDPHIAVIYLGRASGGDGGVVAEGRGKVGAGDGAERVRRG